jgi:hypothetical protein
MGVFDDREKAQENKYFHDEDLRFKAISRRNKLFGTWMAGQLGKTGASVESYVADVLRADMEEAGDADLLRKVTADLKAAGKPVAEKELKAKLEEFLNAAIKELEAGK